MRAKSEGLIKHSHENQACFFLSEYLALTAAGCPTPRADDFGEEFCSRCSIDWDFLRNVEQKHEDTGALETRGTMK